MLKPENKSKLAQILTYHVVAGRVYSGDALQLDSAATVAGPSITITATEAGANINDARLLQTDIDASNGVIHVIDRVLLPTATSSVQAAKPSVNGRAVAKSMLTDAIHRGVPVFNGGHHGQCAQIYTDVLNSVAAMSDAGLSSSRVSSIQGTLSRCGQMSSSTDRAWALRSEIDQLMREL